MAETQADAQAILRSTFEAFGLGDLAKDIFDAYGAGKITETTDIDQIGFQIRDTEAYKRRFKGNLALRAAKKPEFSISQYLKQEQSYKNAIQGRGLPPGFYDTTDAFSNFIANDVSPEEVGDRVTKGYMAVKDANPEVLNQLKIFYPDVTQGDLATYFMDPKVGTDIIVNKAKVAQIGSEAMRQAGIQLTEQEAEALRKEGIEQPLAQKGFAQIASEQQLYNPLQGEEKITTEQQIAGTFGSSQAAVQRIEQRKRKRKAEFETGGAFTTTQAGATGLKTVGE